MLGIIFAVIVIVSFIFGVATGNIESTSEAVFSGASRAVTVTISLVGAMCLWSGILEVLKEAGILRLLTRILRPILRLLFPDAAKKENGTEEICAAIAANILGMGNASTPMALRAMERLAENNSHGEDSSQGANNSSGSNLRSEDDRHSAVASDDMITFAVICTATLAIFPTTVISLRAASGSENPYSVIIPVWITSAIAMITAIFFSKILRLFFKRGKDRL